MLLYNETSPPIPKPNLDRSPSFARRSLSSSPTQQKPLVAQSQIAQSGHRNTITEISLINPRSRSENQNNSNSDKITNNRQTTKSSDFRVKKVSDNNNNSINSSINNNSINNTSKHLDKINEESKKDESESASSAKYKMRYSSARTRTSQQSIVELKPATVEVFFRNTNNKNDPTLLNTKLTAERPDRKPIATTVFPPPKISLKS